tara:strand:+ start:82 stop:672 length:591 start_codon:yes stop_codon:yes gene_type:complete
LTKKYLQLLIILITILISFFVYDKYFEQRKTLKKIDKNKNNEITKFSDENQNNLIKNLKYSVKFNDDNEYMITSDLSELTYENGIEIVLMKKVVAKLINQKFSSALMITSDNAIYNNSTFNTFFEKNVKIEYMSHTILSDKLDVNFKKNIVTVYDNVVYEGLDGNLIADNIVIDLATRDVDIFMNNTKDKIKINTN